MMNLAVNFREKLSDTFGELIVKRPKASRNELCYYADFIELLTLFANDCVSKADVLDRFMDEGEIFRETRIHDGEFGTYDAQDNDKAEAFVNSCFSYIKSRLEQYGNYYPFIYSEVEGLKLVAKEELSTQHRLYIYLLISSSLNNFSKLTTALTSEFEQLSKNVLQNYLPERAKVYGFGANSEFTGNTKDKITKLAQTMHLEFDDRLIQQISQNNSKEEGLDIVGYIPFEDENPNTIIIFGQCACGKNWFGKQNDAKRYERFYKYYINPFTFAFFSPMDFKNSEFRFINDKDLTSGQIIFERRRLLNLADNDIILNLVHSNIIVNKCIDYCEDIV